jgi:hypothetical protein
MADRVNEKVGRLPNRWEQVCRAREGRQISQELFEVNKRRKS